MTISIEGRGRILQLFALGLALLLAVAGLGCVPRPRPTLEAARPVAERFMQDRAEGRVQEAAARLTPAGKGAFDGAGKPVLDLEGLDDKVRAFPRNESSPGVGRYEFVFRIHRVAREALQAAFWDETILVVWQGGEYRIDGASRAAGREAWVEADSALHVRSPQGQELTLGFDDLPDLFSPQGAPEDLQFGVGKEGFVLVAFSPAGDQLAFVTWGTHGFLVVVGLPGGQPRGIDLHFEGAAVDVEWSPDGSRLAAVVDEPTGNQGLFVYTVDPPGRLNLGLRDMFPPEQYSVSEPRWPSAGRMTFHVRAAEGGAPARAGTWQVDFGTGTVSRAGN